MHGWRMFLVLVGVFRSRVFITPCRAGQFLTRLGEVGCFGGTFSTQGGPISLQGVHFVMGK
jgi:hypothetical protein